MQNETRRSWTTVLHACQECLSRVKIPPGHISPLLVRKSIDHVANTDHPIVWYKFAYVANKACHANVDPNSSTQTGPVRTCH